MSFIVMLLKFLFDRIIISIILSVVCIVGRRYLFLLLPIIPVTGWWAAYHIEDSSEVFFTAFIEFFIVMMFFFRMILARRFDFTRCIIILIPLFSLPSLIQAQNHLFLSIFITSLLFMSVGVYDHFASTVASDKNNSMVDWAVVLWIVLHFSVRVYLGDIYNMDFIYYRQGSFWGTNHVVMILILLLPLIRNQYIFVATIGTMLLSFSRGAYLGLVGYVVFWLIFVNKRIPTRTVFGSIFLTAIIYYLIPQSFIDSSFEYLGQRFFSDQTLLLHSFEDPRWEIWEQALYIAKEKNYMGVGLGGFKWAMEEYGFPTTLSNAHNLFLTAFVEGGALFFLALLAFLMHMLKLAYKSNRSIFVGLLVYLIYGMYSGQIYEVAGWVSAMDYYYLLYLYAYLNCRQLYAAENKKT